MPLEVCWALSLPFVLNFFLGEASRKIRTRTRSWTWLSSCSWRGRTTRRVRERTRSRATTWRCPKSVGGSRTCLSLSSVIGSVAWQLFFMIEAHLCLISSSNNLRFDWNVAVLKSIHRFPSKVCLMMIMLSFVFFYFFQTCSRWGQWITSTSATSFTLWSFGTCQRWICGWRARLAVSSPSLIACTTTE